MKNLIRVFAVICTFAFAVSTVEAQVVTVVNGQVQLDGIKILKPVVRANWFHKESNGQYTKRSLTMQMIEEGKTAPWFVVEELPGWYFIIFGNGEHSAENAGGGLYYNPVMVMIGDKLYLHECGNLVDSIGPYSTPSKSPANQGFAPSQNMLGSGNQGPPTSNTQAYAPSFMDDIPETAPRVPSHATGGMSKKARNGLITVGAIAVLSAIVVPTVLVLTRNKVASTSTPPVRPNSSTSTGVDPAGGGVVVGPDTYTPTDPPSGGGGVVVGPG